EAGAYKHNDAITNNISILPERLVNNGYHTYMAGKWNLGVQAHQGPSVRGFESSYALLPPADNHLGYSNFKDTKEYAAYRENGEAIAMLPKDWFSSELFTDKLIEYIDNKKDDRKPWFGYLAFTAPHLPLQAPDEWIDKYTGKYDLGYNAITEIRNNNATALKIFPENLSLEKYAGKAENWENLSLEDRHISSRAMEIYAAMVENMDFHIGRLIQYLDNESLLENTLIIFMSDNGAAGSDSSWRPKLIPRSDWDNSLPNMGREGSWTAYGRGWAEAATAPYKDIKGSLHSGGTLSPTFFWHRSIKNKGNNNRSYLTVMDILPTLLDATQIDINNEKSMALASPPIRGRSFWKLIQGNNDLENNQIRAIPWMTSEKKQALVRWPWKIIRNHDDDPIKDINIENNKWLLFNLEDDPGETNNVSDEYPDIKLELLSAWINV
ncbi:MAG: sulfatase-like hydrolase/transferase, partial [Pseudomonadota bacterium]|nr:sulfatase-like hydrolase/transferase [Pseudomonadota bacterium]